MQNLCVLDPFAEPEAGIYDEGHVYNTLLAVCSILQ